MTGRKNILGEQYRHPALGKFESIEATSFEYAMEKIEEG
jgi:hypothetical protein